MKTNPFGATSLRVSEIGLGCARIGGIFQGGGGGFIELLHAARDGGITFFDTADMYSQGESEMLVGRAFRGRRSEVIIASKAGYKLPGRRKLIATLKPLVRPLIRALGLRRDQLPSAVKGTPSQDFSAAYLTRAVEGSLRRLRTDYIDLLQLHSPPESVVARGEWVGALESLKRGGKIRYYGVSCDTVETGLAALNVGGVASVQFMVNLLEQRATERLLPELRQRRVAGIAREVLANGLLAKPEGEIELAKFSSSAEEQALRKEQLARLRQEAVVSGSSLPRLALDYVLGLDGVSVALIGARSVRQLEELLRVRYA